ncbi:hypothetical protein AAFF_G00049590 [Aldrovandia affinis]|uniref:Uncharacterized protein n=1 Tax=Aldrovandia affinis TaxID=143900 RepID=A0AAD7WFL4_9TELE|nr:hypothetical protein AAFF_G00049590 [Aldrovandia affinis]
MRANAQWKRALIAERAQGAGQITRAASGVSGLGRNGGQACKRVTGTLVLQCVEQQAGPPPPDPSLVIRARGRGEAWLIHCRRTTLQCSRLV